MWFFFLSGYFIKLCGSPYTCMIIHTTCRLNTGLRRNFMVYNFLTHTFTEAWIYITYALSLMAAEPSSLTVHWALVASLKGLKLSVWKVMFKKKSSKALCTTPEIFALGKLRQEESHGLPWARKSDLILNKHKPTINSVWICSSGFEVCSQAWWPIPTILAQESEAE